MSSEYDSDSASDNGDTDWTGEYFNGKYIAISEIGSGSYATVWLSYEIDKKEYCAIKISKDSDYKACVKETEVYNIIKEFNNNEYIMTLKNSFDIVHDSVKYHCEIMELMMGSLYSYIKENGKLSLETTLSVISQIILGLETLHNNNIIHGDLKPENILVCGVNKKVSEFIKKLNIEKIMKNKSKKKISEEIKVCVEKIGINLMEYKNISESISDVDFSSETFEEDLCSEDSLSVVLDINSDNTEVNKVDKIKKIEACNIENLKIKIADLGTCVLPTDKRRKQIQTCYYMSPQILLRCEYNTSSDIWALGCTIYELITGKILFNPDNYNGNEDRFHLYMISCCLGQIPEEIINKSRYKDIYFTTDCKRIKGFKYYHYFDLKDNIKKNIRENTDEILIEKIYNIMAECLSWFPNDLKKIKKTISAS